MYQRVLDISFTIATLPSILERDTPTSFSIIYEVFVILNFQEKFEGPMVQVSVHVGIP